jgi:1,5-anhydro-D-fructose reductase (1,5-anhydro-D-mannitol-forming)
MVPALRAGGSVDWVISSTPDRAASFAATHAIPRHGTDLAAALADPAVQAVYVSSTNPHHLPQAMQAIAAGKHVLCEKPLAMTTADARTMVAAADAARVTLATNHHLRCSGSHRAIRDLIRAGAIGQVLSLRLFHAVHLPPHLQGWRTTTPGAGGGVIPDITVHDADVAMFLLDEMPVSVVAMAGTSGLGQDVEDSAMSVWSMPSGAMVQSHESFTHPFAGSGLQVHGTAGSILADGVMTQRPVGTVTLVTAAGRRDVPFPAHDLYTQGVAEFVAACAGQGRPAATGADGVRSLAVAMAVRQAAQTGQRVTVSA